MPLDSDFQPRLIDDLLERAARLHPTRAAVVSGQGAATVRYDYAEFLRRVDALGAALQGLGIRPDERVAILDKNSHHYLELYFALPRIGAVAVPLNYRLAVRELEYIVADSTATTLLYSTEYAGVATELLAAVPGLGRVIELEGEKEALLASALAAGQTSRRPERSGDDVLLQMYTSGTTGRPKGAMLTHTNMIANTLTTLFERDYTAEDTYLHACPLYHCADLELFYGMTYACGGNVVLRHFDALAVLEAIANERVTVAFLVPAMINFLLERPELARTDLSSWRLCVYGGAAIPEDRLRAALAKLPCKLSQGYGLTETSPVLTVLPWDDHVGGLAGRSPERLKSCGRPAHAVDVKIFDDDDRECPLGAVGEIVARGQNIMKGYWRLPEATAAALRGGWFHTGDMGYRDADGYIYIVDRKKDMIVTGAENVYPREIEEVLYTHPAVLEAAVIGVPDARWGETVKAVVVLRAGVEASPEALIAHCRTALAHFKCPTSVDFVPALPRNPSGKVLKRELREEYWRGHERRVN